MSDEFIREILDIKPCVGVETGFCRTHDQRTSDCEEYLAYEKHRVRKVLAAQELKATNKHANDLGDLLAKTEERYDALQAKVSEARLTGRSSQALGYMEPEKTIARIIAILSDTSTEGDGT